MYNVQASTSEIHLHRSALEMILIMSERSFQVFFSCKKEPILPFFFLLKQFGCWLMINCDQLTWWSSDQYQCYFGESSVMWASLAFIRDCITKAINKNSKCPQCESFAWLKDLKINRELSSAVEFCVDLKKIIYCQSQS